MLIKDIKNIRVENFVIEKHKLLKKIKIFFHHSLTFKKRSKLKNSLRIYFDKQKKTANFHKIRLLRL